MDSFALILLRGDTICCLILFTWYDNLLLIVALGTCFLVVERGSRYRRNKATRMRENAENGNGS